MFSPTVSESNSAPDWNTMVTFLRMRAQFGFVKVGDVFMGHDDAAGVGLQKPHDVAQAHRLAHAAAADDGQRLAGVHVKVDVD